MGKQRRKARGGNVEKVDHRIAKRKREAERDKENAENVNLIQRGVLHTHITKLVLKCFK
jgi:hypothetical protein